MTKLMYEEMLFSSGETATWEKRFRVTDYINYWRKPCYGEVDIVKTAETAGVDLAIEDNHRRDSSLVAPGNRLDGGGNYKLIINALIDPDYWVLAMGHELGHLCMAWGGIRGPHSEREYEEHERFCEYFGRELIIRGYGSLPYTPGQIALFNRYDYENWGEL